MAALRIVGIALLVLGILSLAYQGITYTKSEKVLEVGPITATKETKKTIPLPPVLGGVALVGGLVLLVAKRLRPSGSAEANLMAVAAGSIAGESVMAVIIAALIATGILSG